MLNEAGASRPFPAAGGVHRTLHDQASREHDEEQALFNMDLRALWALVMRERVVIVAIMVACLALGVVSLLVMPRIYTAEATVQVDQQVAKVLGTEENEPLAAGIDAERFLQTQIDVMNSRMMAERVSNTLGLAANDDFLTAMGVSTTFRPGGENRQERVLNVLQKNLVVELKHNSRVVSIGFLSRSPALSARVANTYADKIIENNIQRKFSTSDYSRKFLGDQLAIAKDRLEISERTLIAYARSAKLIDASAGIASGGLKGEAPANGPRSLVTANLVDINERLAAAEALSLQTQQRWEQARQTPLMSLPEVLSNDAVMRLLEKRAELYGELNELLARLKPDHPTVIQSKAQLSQIDSQLKTLAESIRASINNQYVVAARQRDALAGQVAGLKSETLSEQDRSIKYNILNREVDTNRQLYESLLQRFKEVTAQAGVASNNITLVDRAEEPRKQTSPRVTTNMGLALIIGVIGSVLFVLAREQIHNVLRDPHDVEQRFHSVLLGVVPQIKDGEIVDTLDNPKSSVSEAYHSVRNAVQLSGTGGIPGSIVITSSAKSEGKSFTSYALARDFASIGKRVLLVDADLRRPSLHTYFGRDMPKKGLSTVLAGMDTLDAVKQETAHANLTFLPSGALPPNPAALFAGTALQQLLAQAGESYDLVLLDAPPVLALADAPVLASSAAATIFVMEASRAKVAIIRRALGRLHDSGANLLGCVVTKFNSAREGYVYYSDDYYSY